MSLVDREEDLFRMIHMPDAELLEEVLSAITARDEDRREVAARVDLALEVRACIRGERGLPLLVGAVTAAGRRYAVGSGE